MRVPEQPPEPPIRSQRGQTLLKGHALAYEGAAHGENGRLLNYGLGGGDGRALCECGEMSGVLPSNYARKRWHREHKDALR